MGKVIDLGKTLTHDIYGHMRLIIYIQEAVWRRLRGMFGAGTARARASAGEEPKKYPAKEGKLIENLNKSLIWSVTCMFCLVFINSWIINLEQQKKMMDQILELREKVHIQNTVKS
jgi:hypothetical protein